MNRKPKKLLELEPRIIEGGTPCLHAKLQPRKSKPADSPDPDSALPSYMRSVRKRVSRSTTRRTVRSIPLSRAVSIFKEPSRGQEPRRVKLKVADGSKAQLFLTQTPIQGRPEVLTEFAQPNIEEDESEHSEDDLQVHPEDLSPSHRDRFEMQDSIVWFVRAHDQAKKGKWNIAIDSYKQALKLRPDFTICEFNLACCLERVGCWSLSRRWFAK